jgi:hypothetical protein
MAKANVMYQRIVDMLTTKGPMSQIKIMEAMPEFKSGSVASCIRQARGLRKDHTQEKTMYIKGYDPHPGQAGLPSPIIALGNKPCKKMKIQSDLLRKLRYQRYNAKIAKQRGETRAAKKAADDVFKNMVNPPKARSLNKTLKDLPSVRHELYDDVEVAA